jgi:CRISPR-associated endonuclease/helicase Cas3
VFFAQVPVDFVAAVRHLKAFLQPSAFDDETLILKTILWEGLSGSALRPWAIHAKKGPTLIIVGYTQLDADQLNKRRGLALPSVQAAVGEVTAAPLPAFSSGERFRFSVSVVPTIRVTKAEGRRYGERDAFLVKADAAGKDAGLKRDDVYRDYLAERLAGATIEVSRLVQFGLRRFMRPKKDGSVSAKTMPQATSGFAFAPGKPDQLAADVLQRTGWIAWHSGAPALALLDGRVPRPAQVGTLELPIDERFAVIEAPTGTGKTEAALIWTSRLVEAGQVDGLYFAVPTRSAATELHARIGRLMSTHHPALNGKIVRALPGLLDTDNSVPDYPPETWAVAAPKRTFAAPIAVGTIDQALLSIVRARHAWMRAAFLSRHLLVVDEVHASDPYMASLTRGLIERHLSLGGRALAMSATLGETALAILMDRDRRPIDEAIAAPYPAIRRINGDQALPQTSSRTINVVIESFEKAISRARSAATNGQSVLWIRSTVSDAVADFQSFDASGIKSLLHHSRYAVGDRTWLDQQLLSIFGVDGKRGSVIAVTTQTAEQSLDIDADLLITDVCPADVLLQRLGRLHRHRIATRPTAVMIDPGGLDRYLLPKGKVIGHRGQGWPWVYNNLLSVRATLDWLGAGRSISIPEDCRSLVERATHAHYLRELGTSLGVNWTDLWRDLFDDAAMKAQLAEASLIDWERPYREALVNEWLPTRLGEGTITVAVKNLVSPFTGQKIEALPIPGRWLRGVALPDDPINAVNQQLRIETQNYAYDRLGIRRLTD